MRNDDCCGVPFVSSTNGVTRELPPPEPFSARRRMARMATASELSISVWTRVVPRQFSLRALLVVITVSAGFSWWYVQPSRGTLSAWKAAQIKVGMTEAEVFEIVADVQDTSYTVSGLSFTWNYEVRETLLQPRSCLSVTFVGDHVVSVQTYP